MSDIDKRANELEEVTKVERGLDDRALADQLQATALAFAALAEAGDLPPAVSSMARGASDLMNIAAERTLAAAAAASARAKTALLAAMEEHASSLVPRGARTILDDLLNILPHALGLAALGPAEAIIVQDAVRLVRAALDR